MRILVVGASGILAPAAADLIGRGHAVTGIARSGEGIPVGVESVLGDARDPATFEGLDVDRALVYRPATTEEALAVLRARARGSVVVVEVSAAADPARGPLELAPDTLLLGWEPGEAGARWHSPAEVSRAALEVFDDGRSRVLGAVRPWTDRPSA